MKGQTVVVGAIILVLVFVGIAGSLFLFVQRTSKTVTEEGGEEIEEQSKRAEAAFAINKLYPPNKIEVKNIGETTLQINSFTVYINNSRTSFTTPTCGSTLQPKGKCNLSSIFPSLNAGTLRITGEYRTWDQLNLTQF